MAQSNVSVSKVSLRPATTADVDAILEVEGRSFTSPGVAFNRRQVRRLLANPRAVVLVAAGGSQTLGWGAALVRQSAAHASGRVYSLAVHPDARGRGVGRKLLQGLIGRLQRRGVRRVSLEVESTNQAAVALYESLGFKGDEPLADYYGPGKLGRRMRLDGLYTGTTGKSR